MTSGGVYVCPLGSIWECYTLLDPPKSLSMLESTDVHLHSLKVRHSSTKRFPLPHLNIVPIFLTWRNRSKSHTQSLVASKTASQVATEWTPIISRSYGEDDDMMKMKMMIFIIIIIIRGRWWAGWPVEVAPSTGRSRCSADQEAPNQALSPGGQSLARSTTITIIIILRQLFLGSHPLKCLTSSKKSSAVSCDLSPSFCSFLTREHFENNCNPLLLEAIARMMTMTNKEY